MKNLKLITLVIIGLTLTGCSLLPQAKKIQSNVNTENKEITCLYQLLHPDWRCYNGMTIAEIMLPPEFGPVGSGDEDQFGKFEGAITYPINTSVQAYADASQILLKEGKLIEHFQQYYAGLCSDSEICPKIENWEYITVNEITYLKTHENVALGIGDSWQERSLYYRTFINGHLYSLSTTSVADILESGQVGPERQKMVDENIMDQILTTFVPVK